MESWDQGTCERWRQERREIERQRVIEKIRQEKERQVRECLELYGRLPTYMDKYLEKKNE